MNTELNKLIGQIFTKNKENSKGAVQELFLLLGNQPQESQVTIQKAILFAMENMHEWSNIIKYTEKWKMEEYKAGLILRMKKRLNQTENQDDIDPSKDQLKRLIQKYWRVRSPQMQENTYREPINLKKVVMNMNTESLNKNSQSIPHEKINVQPLHKPETQNKAGNEQENQQQNFVKTPKQTNKQVERLYDKQRERNINKDRADPLASLTGRPPILKKTSTLLDINKVKNTNNMSINTVNQQKVIKSTQENIKNRAARITSTNVAKILQSYHQNKQQSQSSKEVIQQDGNNKLDQKFPPQKLFFGSNKKTKEPEISKKMTISPKKYQPQKRIIKIKKPQRKSQKEVFIQKQKKLPTQFSFSKDKQNLSKQPKTQVHTQNPLSNHFDSFFEDKNLKPEQQKINDSKSNKFVDDSFGAYNRDSQPTPMFMVKDSKRRKSNREQFLTEQELCIIDSKVQPKYHMKELYHSLGISSLKYLAEAFKI